MADLAALSSRYINTSFGDITPMEYTLFLNLDRLGTFSRLQMLRLGVPSDIMRKLIKHGLLTLVAHPTKVQYRVSDGIIQE